MILFIDATVRESSRTKCLAEYLLGKFDDSIVSLKLNELIIPALDEDLLNQRTQSCNKNDYSDPYFEYAKQFAAADRIVIAAPFWDLSFPAVLKRYIETICVSGITFQYSAEGIPIGLCQAKKLYYVTTAGGTIFNPEFGFGYIKALAQQMFGIKECICLKAENLDIVGNDVDAIMRKSFIAADKLEL